MSFIVIPSPTPPIVIEDVDGGIIVAPSSESLQVVASENVAPVLMVTDDELFWGPDGEGYIRPLFDKKIKAEHLEVDEFDPSILDDLFGAKVDKVEGMGLSSNDFTDDDVTAVSKIVIDGDGSKALRDDGTYQDQTPPPRIISLYLDDVQEVEEDAVSYRLPFDMIITQIVASVGVAPVGADLILDIHRKRWNSGTNSWDEVSIYTTQANRPKITAGNIVGTAVLPDISVLLEGDILELQVDQVGSSTPGSNLNVTLIAGDMLPESTFTAALLESLKGEPGLPGEDGNDGVGLPTGGTTGQILAKMTNNDFEFEWVNQAAAANAAYSEYVDSFTTDPMVSRVASRVNGTWTHEATEKALKVVADQTGSGAFAAQIGAPYCGDFGRIDVQCDFKIVTDSAARKHVGLFIEVDGTGATGYRIAGLDNTLKISRFTNGGSESVLATINTSGFSTGTTYTLRVIIDFAMSKMFVFLDGAFLGAVSITATDLHGRPGYFAYGSTVYFDNLDYRYTSVNVLSTAFYTRTLNSVDEPPTSPNAKDDEFVSTTLDSKWSWANQGSAAYSLTSKAGFLGLTPAGDSNHRCLVQTKPSGNWRATAKVHWGGDFVADSYGGIVVLPATDGGVEALVIGKDGTSSPSKIRGEYWSAFNSWGSERCNVSFGGTSGYLRIVWNGSQLTYYVSSDGVSFSKLANAFTPSITPGRIGITARGLANPTYFEWFRVEAM